MDILWLLVIVFVSSLPSRLPGHSAVPKRRGVSVRQNRRHEGTGFDHGNSVYRPGPESGLSHHHYADSAAKDHHQRQCVS